MVYGVCHASTFVSHSRFVYQGEQHSWYYPVGCLWIVQLNKQSREWCRMWSWLPMMALLNCTSMGSFSISGRSKRFFHRKSVCFLRSLGYQYNLGCLILRDQNNSCYWFIIWGVHGICGNHLALCQLIYCSVLVGRRHHMNASRLRVVSK